jgi:hypothetical protein
MAHLPNMTLTIRNELPLKADEIGSLLKALAADYRRLSRGRTLVVERLETGSLIAHLMDMFFLLKPHAHDLVETAAAIKAGEYLLNTLKKIYSEIKSKKLMQLQRPNRASKRCATSPHLRAVRSISNLTVQMK